MKNIKDTDTNQNRLLQGESGTGKELVVRAIHHHSGRAEAPMVPVDCAAINRNLIEEISTGGFRQDLYYHLSSVTLMSPPLKERGQDIQLLASGLMDPPGRTCGACGNLCSQLAGISRGPGRAPAGVGLIEAVPVYS